MTPFTTSNNITHPNKKIILCADDYGQNNAISEGIITLANLKRINAISCMVNSKHWSAAYRPLYSVRSSTFIGLHLNLTFGQPISDLWRQQYGNQLFKLPLLLAKTISNTCNQAVIAAEIQAQIDCFYHSMDAYPDFIDGHEHCHQLPMVRDVLLSKGILIRNTCNGYQDFLSWQHFPKRQLITLLGGLTYKKQLLAQQLHLNTSFSGIYNFKQAPNYRHHFKQFLSNTIDDGLIMCHPGKPSNDQQDALARFRHHEFTYLLSDAFMADCAHHSIQLRIKEALL